MLNLNKSWVQKQGDFFVESPIILLAAIIWYLRIYKDGKYCTFPHAIEFLNKPYADIFTILTSYPSLENYLSPFMDAWQGGAQDQLQGQIASAKIPLSRMISPQLYWVMTGDDFTLDLNNPEHPKILCVGNNPDRQNIYSAALGLYNSRIVKLVNKKGQLKSSIIIDELPTIYFRGIDNLIATARSNKVAVCLGFQDFSQLTRDYGEKEAKVIQNTVGQYLLRAGGRGNGQKPFGTFRQDSPATAVHLHQQAGHIHLHQHAAGLADTGIQDSQPLAGHIRGQCGGQLRGRDRPEDFPCPYHS